MAGAVSPDNEESQSAVHCMPAAACMGSYNERVCKDCSLERSGPRALPVLAVCTGDQRIGFNFYPGHVTRSSLYASSFSRDCCSQRSDRDRTHSQILECMQSATSTKCKIEDTCVPGLARQ